MKRRPENIENFERKSHEKTGRYRPLIDPMQAVVSNQTHPYFLSSRPCSENIIQDELFIAEAETCFGKCGSSKAKQMEAIYLSEH